MTELKIKKWGDSLVLTLSSDIQELYNLKEDDWIDVDFAKVIKLKRVKIS